MDVRCDMNNRIGNGNIKRRKIQSIEIYLLFYSLKIKFRIYGNVNLTPNNWNNRFFMYGFK